jgi:hypothetical protein
MKCLTKVLLTVALMQCLIHYVAASSRNSRDIKLNITQYLYPGSNVTDYKMVLRQHYPPKSALDKVGKFFEGGVSPLINFLDLVSGPKDAVNSAKGRCLQAVNIGDMVTIGFRFMGCKALPSTPFRSNYALKLVQRQNRLRLGSHGPFFSSPVVVPVDLPWDGIVEVTDRWTDCSMCLYQTRQNGPAEPVAVFQFGVDLGSNSDDDEGNTPVNTLRATGLEQEPENAPSESEQKQADTDSDDLGSNSDDDEDNTPVNTLRATGLEQEPENAPSESEQNQADTDSDDCDMPGTVLRQQTILFSGKQMPGRTMSLRPRGSEE